MSHLYSIAHSHSSYAAAGAADGAAAAAGVARGVTNLRRTVEVGAAVVRRAQAFAAVANDHLQGVLRAVSVEGLQRQFKPVTIKSLSEIDSLTIDIIHDVRCRKACRNGKPLDNREQLVDKINRLLGLVRLNSDIMAKKFKWYVELESVAQRLPLFEQMKGHGDGKLMLAGIIIPCNHIITGGYSPEFDKRMSELYNQLERLLSKASHEASRFTPDEVLSLKQKIFDTLRQLKSEYEGELLEWQFNAIENLCQVVLAYRESPYSFEIFKFLIENLSDSYTDFIVYDILRSAYQGPQKLELLDLALQNEKVRASFHKNGVHFIHWAIGEKTWAGEEMLTEEILEKFFLAGFNLTAQANGLSLLDVIREDKFSTQPSLVLLMADFFDVNAILGSEAAARMTAVIKGEGELLPQDQNIDLILVQRMNAHQIYQRACQAVGHEEKQIGAPLNPVAAQVFATIGISKERPEGTGIPLDLVRIMADADGYDNSGAAQAIASKVQELRRPMYGPMLPKDDSAAAAGAATAASVEGSASGTRRVAPAVSGGVASAASAVWRSVSGWTGRASGVSKDSGAECR